jgi:UDP:flavonoid glycosyltransferase YjiC (YdhE family)
LNAVRKRYSLPMLSDLRSVYTDSDITLFADVPSLVPMPYLPPSNRYIGPVLWSPKTIEPSWWGQLPPARIAYVTMGSTGNVELLPMLLEALEDAGYVTLVATAGRTAPVERPGKRFTAMFLPGEAAADRAEIVICNGGSATVYQALSRGKPVLGICSNMDQFLTMGCVERAGAGLTVRASTANSRLLADAIARLKTENGFSLSARKVQEEFINYPSSVLFPEAVETFMSSTKSKGPELGALAKPKSKKA